MALPISVDGAQPYVLRRANPVSHSIGGTAGIGDSRHDRTDVTRGPGQARPRPAERGPRPLSPQRLFLAPQHSGTAPPPTRPPPRIPQPGPNPTLPNATMPAPVPHTVMSPPPRDGPLSSSFRTPSRHRNRQVVPVSEHEGMEGVASHASPQRLPTQGQVDKREGTAPPPAAGTAAAFSPAQRGRPRSSSFRIRIPGFASSHDPVPSSPSRPSHERGRAPASPFSPARYTRGSPSAKQGPLTAPLGATLSLDRQQGAERSDVRGALQPQAGGSPATKAPAPLRLATQAPGSPWRSVGTPPRTPRQGADRPGAFSPGPWERRASLGAHHGGSFDSPPRQHEARRHGPQQQQQQGQGQGVALATGSGSEGLSTSLASSVPSLPKGWPAGLFQGPDHFPPQVPHDYCSPYTSRHRPRVSRPTVSESDAAGGAPWEGQGEEVSSNSARTLITQFGSELGSVRKPEAPARQDSKTQGAPSDPAPSSYTPSKRHLIIRQLLPEATTQAEAKTGALGEGPIAGVAESSVLPRKLAPESPGPESKASKSRGGRSSFASDQGEGSLQPRRGGAANSRDRVGASAGQGKVGERQASPAKVAAREDKGRGLGASALQSAAQRTDKRQAGAHAALGAHQRAHSFSSSRDRSRSRGAPLAHQDQGHPGTSSVAQGVKSTGAREGVKTTGGREGKAGTQAAGGTGGNTPKKMGAGTRPVPRSPSARSAPLSPRRATSLRQKGAEARGQKPRPPLAQRSPSQLPSPRLTESPDMNQKAARETHLLSPPQAEWDEQAVEGLGPQETQTESAVAVEGAGEAEWEAQGQAAQGQGEEHEVEGPSENAAAPPPSLWAQPRDAKEGAPVGSGSEGSGGTPRAAQSEQSQSEQSQAGQGGVQAEAEAESSGVAVWAQRKWSRPSEGPRRVWEAAEGESDTSSSDEESDREPAEGDFSSQGVGIPHGTKAGTEQRITEGQGLGGVEGVGSKSAAQAWEYRQGVVLEEGAVAHAPALVVAPSVSAAEDDGPSFGLAQARGSGGVEEPEEVQGLVFGIPVVDQDGPVIHPLSRSSAAFGLGLGRGAPARGVPLPWAPSVSQDPAPAAPLSNGSLVSLCNSSGVPLAVVGEGNLGSWRLALAPGGAPSSSAAPGALNWGPSGEAEEAGRGQQAQEEEEEEEEEMPEARLFLLCYLGDRRIGLRSIAAEGRCLGARTQLRKGAPTGGFHGAAASGPWDLCHFTSWKFGESEAWRVLSATQGSADWQPTAHSTGAWSPAGRGMAKGILPGPLVLRNEANPGCTLELAVYELMARPSEAWRSLQRSAAQVPLLLRNIQLLSQDRGTPALAAQAYLAQPGESGPEPSSVEALSEAAQAGSSSPSQDPAAVVMGSDSVAGRVEESSSDSESVHVARHSPGARHMTETMALPDVTPDSKKARARGSREGIQGLAPRQQQPGEGGYDAGALAPRAWTAQNTDEREGQGQGQGKERDLAEGGAHRMAHKGDEHGGKGQAESAPRRRVVKDGAPRVGHLFRPPSASAAAASLQNEDSALSFPPGKVHAHGEGIQKVTGDGKTALPPHTQASQGHTVRASRMSLLLAEAAAVRGARRQGARMPQTQAREGAVVEAEAEAGPGPKGMEHMPQRRSSAAWRQSQMLSEALVGTTEKDTQMGQEGGKAQLGRAQASRENELDLESGSQGLATPEGPRPRQEQRAGESEGRSTEPPPSELKQRLSALRKRVAALKEQPQPEGGEVCPRHATEGEAPHRGGQQRKHEDLPGSEGPVPRELGHYSTPSSFADAPPYQPLGRGTAQRTPTPAPALSGGSDGPLMGSPEDGAPGASSSALAGVRHANTVGSPHQGEGGEQGPVGAVAGGYPGAHKSPLRRSLSTGAAPLRQRSPSPAGIGMAPGSFQEGGCEKDRAAPALPRSLSQSRLGVPGAGAMGGESPYAPVILGLRSKKRALKAPELPRATPGAPPAPQAAPTQAHPNLGTAGTMATASAEGKPSPEHRSSLRRILTQEGSAAGAQVRHSGDQKENGMGTVRPSPGMPAPAPKPAARTQPSNSSFLRRHLQQLAGANEVQPGAARESVVKGGSGASLPAKQSVPHLSASGVPQLLGRPREQGPQGRTVASGSVPHSGSTRAPLAQKESFARRPVTLARRG